MNLRKYLVFLFGSVLQISILVLMAKRKARQRKEVVFSLLTFSTLVWNFGIFVSLFCGYLYKGSSVVEQIFGSVALLGFVLLHPLLVHTLLNFMETQYPVRMNKFFKYFILSGIYLPNFSFAWSISQILLKDPP